ncbi:uridine diphosphate glucose pyrophosphatase NUDT14 [Grus japonensis]|uniref:Uridine diphosphate glucose pyrophosphatase NUDT14 n=1 Tax=Grus japonensis TaxID=30415 RepID=A0ABC9X0U1_GRUJA
MEAIEELAVKPCTSSLYLRPFRLCYRQISRMCCHYPQDEETCIWPPSVPVCSQPWVLWTPTFLPSGRYKGTTDDGSTSYRLGQGKQSANEEIPQMHVLQNGTKKFWDFMRTHDSVSILIFNTSRQCFVVVKQFRPAVYMCEVERHHPQVFQHQDKESFSRLEDPLPAVEGVTYELCAGIVDKPDLSLEDIACGEVLEECGYRVPVTDLRRITSYRSGVGVTGSRQTLFYAEVTDQMRTGEGGGQPEEGELIEVVEVPLEDAMKFAYDETLPKTMGVIFSFMWFQNNIAPKLPKK